MSGLALPGASSRGATDAWAHFAVARRALFDPNPPPTTGVLRYPGVNVPEQADGEPGGGIPHVRRGQAGVPMGMVALADILNVAEGIRDDVRAMETRLAADIRDVRDDFEGFVSEHVKTHGSDSQATRSGFDKLTDRLNAYDLEQARKQGTWGMVRWTFDLLGRNWKLIATAALALLTFFGNIRISVLSF